MININLVFENNGKIIEMGNNTDIGIDSINGLVSAEYSNRSKSHAIGFGETLLSKQINKRIINLVFTIIGLKNKDDLRQKIIHLFNPLFTTNLKINYWGHELEIDCEIESLKEYQYENFYEELSFELELSCFYPFFKSLDDFGKNIANTLSQFAFPLSFAKENSINHHEKGKVFSYNEFAKKTKLVNDGDIDVGFDVYFIATRGPVTNPKLIHNLTNKFLSVNYEMLQGDIIKISTKKGLKKVELIRNNNTTNISNNLTFDSNYFVFEVGNNEISYDATLNYKNLDVKLFFKKEYLGV